MLKIKNMVFSVILVLFLSACVGGTPKGTDADVKKLVIDITMKEIKKQLVPVMYEKVTNVPARLIGLNVTYEGLLKNIDKEKNSKVIEAIDEAMAKISIALENIRVDSIDDEIHKSKSSANIVINGKTTPITYTAQKNSDGEIYVEVFGL